jgi:DNA-binding transcriptional LysR family regulator
MEIKNLRAFVEVVRRGGFTEAGKIVYLSQSSVSKAIKQLEEQLGVVLLERNSHKVGMTAAGQIVFNRALKILEEQGQLIAELSDLQGLLRGTLRLGLPTLGSDRLFAPLFAVYRQKYPGIEISLMENASRQLEELVRNGTVDLGTSLLPVADDFSFKEVRDEPLDALIPYAHPHNSSRPIELDELRGQPFVMFEAGFALNGIILQSCRSLGYEPSIVARSSQVSFISELVGLGMGVAFLPRFIAQDIKDSRIRVVAVTKPEMRWRMAWIWRQDAELAMAAKAWLDLSLSKTD